MNTHKIMLGCSALALSIFPFLASCGVGQSPNGGGKYATTHDIQMAYEQRFNALHLDPQYPSYEEGSLKTMLGILDEAGEGVFQRELTRLSTTSVDVSPINFEFELCRALFIRLCDRGDLVAIEHLLAMNYPEWNEVSIKLAYMKQPDGVLVLTTAYDEAGSQHAAKILAEVIRQMFSTLQRPGETDKEVVDAIAKFWKGNYMNYVINRDSTIFTQPFDHGQVPDLFVPKEKQG